MFDFEKFEVYKKSERLYRLLIFSVLNQKSLDKSLKDQLRRASLSIVLNIAEGAGKFAQKDKKNYYAISRGSVNECVAIIRLLKIENIINDITYEEAYRLLLEMAKMLSALIIKFNK